MGSLFFAINEPFGGFWRSRNKFSTARGNFPTNSNEREPLMCPLKVKASLNKVRPTHASASLIWYRQTFLAPHFKHHHIKHILLACWCWATQQNVMILLLHCAVVCVRNNTFLTLGGFLYKSLLRCRKVCSRQTFQVVVVESSKVGGEFSSPLHSKRSLENSHCNYYCIQSVFCTGIHFLHCTLKSNADTILIASNGIMASWLPLLAESIGTYF